VENLEAEHHEGSSIKMCVLLVQRGLLKALGGECKAIVETDKKTLLEKVNNLGMSPRSGRRQL